MLIQNKKYTLRVSILAFFVAFLVQGITAPKAQAWGDAIPAELMHQAWRPLYDNYIGVLLGTAKMAAIQAINQQVNMLIGGASYGQPLIITNWNDFLYQTPLQVANDYLVSDFFLRTTRGKYSSANYLGVGNLKSIAGNYQNYLVAQAKLATVDAAHQAIVMNLDEFTPSPDAMFREGDFRAFNAFVSNPANNPYGYVLMAEEVYRTKLTEEMRLAEIKAQSSGFLGVERNGMTITPAGAIQALNSMDIQNMGNLITGATNPAELLSGTVMAMANRMVSQMVQQGIGSVGAQIQRQVSNAQQQVNTALNDATKSLGPAGPYVNAAVRQGATNVRINATTPALPTPSNQSAVSP